MKKDQVLYDILRARYLKAIENLHLLETSQANTRMLLKIATEPDDIKALRAILYINRKVLAARNRAINTYYTYIDRN